MVKIRSVASFFPGLGLFVGAMFFLGDWFVNLGTSLSAFGGRDLGWSLLTSLALYLAAFGLVDLVLSFGLPRGRPWARRFRGAILVALAAGSYLAVGRSIEAPAVALAALAVLLLEIRFAPQVAVAAMALLLMPMVRPASMEAGPVGTPQEGAPSILLVVLDTVRVDRTSAYGYPRETTPTLEKLAVRGTRFARAYSTSCWSLPAHASLFTGVLPRDHDAHYESLQLAEGVPTLAESLRDAGHETAAFTANPWISEKTGLARGFGVLQAAWQQHTVQSSLIAWQILTRYLAFDRDKGGRDVVRGLRRWLRERDGDRPYFAFVNLMEAHAPYQAVPRRYRRRYVASHVSDRAVEAWGDYGWWAQWAGFELPPRFRDFNSDLMDGATAAVDAYLEELVRAAGPGVVVVVTSDQGDLLGEHALFGHNFGLYEPLIRVPLVLAGPGVPEGRVDSRIASHVDVAPTLAALAGVALDGVGEDLLDPAATEEGERVVRAEHFRVPKLADRGWTRFRSPDDVARFSERRAAAVGLRYKRLVSESDGRVVDLVRDPGETESVDVSGLPPLSLPAPRTGVPVEIDGFQRQALRALGYVD